MASVPSEVLSEFLTQYPTVEKKLVIEAAKAAGQVNGGVNQVRGLVVREILGSNGAPGQQLVRQIFGKDATNLIDQYYREEEHH